MNEGNNIKGMAWMPVNIISHGALNRVPPKGTGQHGLKYENVEFVKNHLQFKKARI